VESGDPRYRDLTIGETLLSALTRRLEEPDRPQRAVSAEPLLAAGPERTTLLDTLDLSQSVDKEKYDKKLAKRQAKLYKLSRAANEQGLSTVMVFEGWDAGGKGGIIRRMIKPMDARHYRVIPISAPTEEELRYHYLWRFWRHLPRAGHMVIFDRSWYGRVLVERVESLATEAEWMRAYAEINGFEEMLQEHGVLLLKFWLHIDPEEQLRRFRERENTPFKRYKISDEDWRNRERWDEYELAANDMVQRTSTQYARWQLVPANDKRFARLQVLKTVCRALKERL
jgi:polyphosphate kinase 2 (PPK2 family)